MSDISNPEDINEAELLPLFTPLLAQWGVSPLSIELASLSENTVFKVTTAEQRRYALRIHRPGYHTLAELESEHLWAQALIDAGVKIPRAFETLEGSFYERFQWRESAAWVGLVEWLDAEPLHSMINTDTSSAFMQQKLTELGSICARLHNQASGWQPPAGFTRHHLNIDGFLGEAPFWGRFWDAPLLKSSERELILTAREQLRDILAAYGENPSTYSMIHADLHDGNILVTDKDLMVIDFDDAGFGWHVYDIAVALSPYLHRKDYADMEQTFLDAYRINRQLADEELSLLPYFFLIRTLASIGWSTARPELENTDKVRWLIGRACNQIQTLGIK